MSVVPARCYVLCLTTIPGRHLGGGDTKVTRVTTRGGSAQDHDHHAPSEAAMSAFTEVVCQERHDAAYYSYHKRRLKAHKITGFLFRLTYSELAGSESYLLRSGQSVCQDGLLFLAS